MNKSMLNTRTAQLFTLGLLLIMVAFWPNGAEAAPMQQTDCSGTMDVATEAELNNAFACFNASTSGASQINIVANITLTGNTTQINNTSFAPQLRIVGGNHTIDGDAKGRILDIQDGQVSIFDLTVQNGVTDGNPNGAGLYVGSAATVLATSLDVLSNTSTGDGSGIFTAGFLGLTGTVAGNKGGNYGGGIANYGQLIITNSTIRDNEANTGGGGLDNEGTATISNSTFSGNQVSSAGSAIASYADDVLILRNSTVTGNSGDRGAILARGTATIQNSTIVGNTGGNTRGGGVHQNGGTTTMSNSIVANNSGAGDCGVESGTLAAGSNNLDTDGSCGDATTATSAQINLGPLQDNGGQTHTMALGAGSVAIDAATADTQITEDQRGLARPQGAAADIGAFEYSCGNQVRTEAELNEAIRCYNLSDANASALILEDITLTRDTIPVNNPNDGATLIMATAVNDPKVIDGGGVARILDVRAGTVELVNTIFQNGSGDFVACAGGQYKCGGAMYIGGTSDVKFTNGTLSNNTADFGGAIWVEDDAKLEFVSSGRGNTLSGNSSTQWGGAIAARDNASLSITSATLSSNASVTGGAVYVIDSVPLLMNGVTISDNNSSQNGGGLYIGSGVSSDIRNSVISNNRSEQLGGGLYTVAATTLTVENVDFLTNSAAQFGGAMETFGTTSVIGSRFFGNSSATAGAIDNEGVMTISDSTFENNTATANGGAIVSYNSLIIERSTLANNRANGAGGAIQVATGGTMTMSNSTVTNNSANSTGAITSTSDGTTVTISNSTIANNSSDTDRSGGIGTGGQLTLNNSIVALNTNANGNFDCQVFANGALNSGSNNLDSDGRCGNALTGTSAEIDLGSLQDNGGPTHTMALGPNSIARDAATTDAAITVDQRGEARPYGSAPDIGAFELNLGEANLSVSLTADSGSIIAGDSVTFSLEVTNAGPDAAIGTKVSISSASSLAGLTLESLPAECAPAGAAIVCDLGTIEVNGSKKLEYTLKFSETGSFSSDVSVTSDTADSTAGNNADSASVTIGAEPPVNTGVTIFLPLITR